MIAVQAAPFEAAALLADFAARAAGAGAVASFTGLVRGENDGAAVSGLELDHHPRLTEKAIAAIGAEAVTRFQLIDVAIVHRFGALTPGEPIVFVAAAAAHRRAAFDAVDFVIDRLKTAVPLWKCESRGPARTWVEARPQDHADAARWESR